jgi:hypothetical protein
MSSDNNADKNSSAQNEYPVKIDEQALAARIDPLSYNVLRKAATEQAFTGEYTDIETVGVYKCKACAAELFRSETKFHSGCGWPSFYAPSADDAVRLVKIAHCFQEFEQRFFVHRADLTWDMFLTVKAMTFQQINAGASTPYRWF